MPAGDRSARGGLIAWAKALHIQPIYGAFVGRIETSPIGVCFLTFEVLGVLGHAFCSSTWDLTGARKHVRWIHEATQV